MIYAIREAETGLTKIGMCRSRWHTLNQRIPSIRYVRKRQTGRKVTLHLLVWADWPHDTENKLHRYLWREWHNGEWFSDSPRLRQCLEWMKSAPSAYFDFLTEFKLQESSLPRSQNHNTRGTRVPRVPHGASKS